MKMETIPRLAAEHAANVGTGTRVAVRATLAGA